MCEELALGHFIIYSLLFIMFALFAVFSDCPYSSIYFSIYFWFSYYYLYCIVLYPVFCTAAVL